MARSLHNSGYLLDDGLGDVELATLEVEGKEPRLVVGFAHLGHLKAQLDLVILSKHLRKMMPSARKSAPKEVGLA